jgi:hypothetical protein
MLIRREGPAAALAAAAPERAEAVMDAAMPVGTWIAA